MEKSSLKLTKDYENYFLSVKVIKSEKTPEDHILLSLTSEEDEMKWALEVDLTKLIDIDPIFKKFPDLVDICDLLEQSHSDNKVELNFRDLKALLKFHVSYIKQEAFPMLILDPCAELKEDPLVLQLRSLQKEIEALKQKGKSQVISYVGSLEGTNPVSGTLFLKRKENVVFHLFIEYLTPYGSNGEENLFLKVIDEKNEEVVKEKLIFKTHHATYQGGSGYQDSKNVNFMFIENIPKGKHTITLLKKGNSTIYTLYLLAEI